jgi:hypothetical protein
VCHCLVNMSPLSLSLLIPRRKLYRKVKFSLSTFSFYQFNERNLKNRGFSTTSQFATLPAILQQFCAPLSLEIDIDDRLKNDYRGVDRLLGAGSTEVDPSQVPAEGSITESLCPVRDLVLRSTHHIPRIPDVLPFPLLTRLHVTAAFGFNWRLDNAEDYRQLFHFETVATIWRSLKEVQVCVRVDLPWCPEHLNIWNLWVSSRFFSQLQN